MGLPGEDVEQTRLSALLHDVGKIGVDDRIIRKPTALTEEEFEAMKTHPIKGAAIMSAIPQLAGRHPGNEVPPREVERAAVTRKGSSGERIPLQARIVSVADTFDAMTTTRPYQKAMEIDFVIERIRQLAGVRYDPEVVAAFVSAYEKGDLMPIPVASTPRRKRFSSSRHSESAPLPFRELAAALMIAGIAACGSASDPPRRRRRRPPRRSS